MIRFCASLCFLNDAATPEIYTLSLHDALPIYQRHEQERQGFLRGPRAEDARHLRKQQVFAHAWRGHAEDLLQLQGLESPPPVCLKSFWLYTILPKVPGEPRGGMGRPFNCSNTAAEFVALTSNWRFAVKCKVSPA